MYYYLEASPGQNNENFILSGTIYNKDGETVKNIFDPGISLEESHRGEKFTIVVDEKQSFEGKWVDMIYGFVKDAGTIFIASPKTCKLFEQIGLNNLEYFDLSIVTKKGKNDDYKIINVVGKIDCIDDDESEIEYYRNGNVEYVEKLVFDEDKTPKDLKIFLLGKHNTAEIFIHESVKEAIDKNLEGFALTPLDEYIVD